MPVRTSFSLTAASEEATVVADGITISSLGQGDLEIQHPEIFSTTNRDPLKNPSIHGVFARVKRPNLRSWVRFCGINSMSAAARATPGACLSDEVFAAVRAADYVFSVDQGLA